VSTHARHLFLVVFDRHRGESTVEDLGTDVGSAMTTYRDREHQFGERDDFEVALFGSSSEATLRRTHSSYFGAADGLGPLSAAG
jgi:hypothetical protein